MRVSAATSHLLARLLFLDAALAAVLPPLAQQTAATLAAPDSAVSNAPSAATGSSDGLASLSASPLLPAETIAATAGVDNHGASRTDGSSTISTVPTVSAAVSVTPGIISSNNALLFNATLAQGGLPLRPEITPGWSVAGVLLMLSGSAYALVGIKSRWLHCFFSTAFLASLGVTVLLVYVMNPPVSKGLQGAYIAAAAGSGVILGSVSFIFQDILECLACLLGGFCLCMWTLTLKPSGLLGSGGDRNIIFISLISATSLAAFFSRWTRTYFMIGCISISGATAIILGIDCFSRAGLKEYWVYIWGLNDKIFPLDVRTFPLTRGIRVEQAAIIIIFFGAIMSQLKVWKLIKERRARKDAARLEKEAVLQRENLEAGRIIESQNAVERRDWDAVHGDPVKQAPSSIHTAQTSSIEDAEMEKQSVVNMTARTPTPVIAHDQIELGELGYDLQRHSPILSSCRTAAELVMVKGARDGILTIQVAEDLEAPVSPASERDFTGHDTPPQDVGKISHVTASPEIVPLPFNVPNTDNHDDATSTSKSDDDSSSILVNAEPNNDSQAPVISRSRESSFTKRLSADSVNIRRISEDSISNCKQSKTEAREPYVRDEEAIVSVHGDRDSIAATFDNESSVDDHFTDSSDNDRRLSVGTQNRTGDEILDQEKKATLRVGEITSAKVSDNGLDSALVVTAIDWANIRATPPETQADPVHAEDGEGEIPTGPSKSMPSETDSPPVFLTKEHLPTALSRVALSYRTNEWAKHLSHAEAPAPDDLVLPGCHEQTSHTKNEPAAPVNVAALRQTATTATVVPAMPRSSQAVSRSSSSQRSAMGGRASHRSSSHLEISSVPKNISPLPSPILDAKRAVLMRHASMGSHDHSRNNLVRRESKQGTARTLAVGRPGNTPLLTSTAEMSGALPAIAAPAPTSANPTPVSRPPVPGVVSYDSPQTLIGQRAILMRAKTHALNSETLRGSPIPLAPPSPAPITNPQSSVRRRASDTYRRSSDTNASSQVVGSSGFPSMSRVNSFSSTHSGSRGGAARHDMYQAIDSSKPPPAHRRVNLPSLPQQQQQQQQQQQSQAGPRQSYQPSRRCSSGAAAGVAPQAGFYAQANYYYSQGGGNGNGGYPRQQQQQQQQQHHHHHHQPQQHLYHSTASQSNGHLIHSVYGVPGTSMSNSLLPHQTQVSDPEVGRKLELQRQYLMNQQVASAAQLETRMAQKQRDGQRFELRMRTDSEMLDAHRDAMRKMQSRVG